MDKINFLAKDDFPASSDTLNRLQEATNMLATLALLGGSNYILSGCNPKDGKIEPGIVVLGGEILPFLGGAAFEYIIIRETKKTLEYDDELYPEAYIDRVAVFAEDGKFKWNDLKQVISNLELQKRFESIKGDEPAVTKGWAGFIAKIPKDHMLCDGRTLLKAEYPELFENVGTIYGGDGVVSFKIPNYGGRFGVCYTGGGDYKEIGDIGGEEYHLLLADEMAEHDHVGAMPFNKLSARASDINERSTPGSVDEAEADREYNVASMTNAYWQQATMQKVGKNKPHENRPPYYVEGKIIKVR